MSAAAGAAAAAAIADAIKASGVLVRVEPRDFLLLLRRQSEPLVVHALGGFLRKHHQYLSSYKGLAFHTKSAEPLSLPSGTEVINARGISIPG